MLLHGFNVGRGLRLMVPGDTISARPQQKARGGEGRKRGGEGRRRGGEGRRRGEGGEGREEEREEERENMVEEIGRAHV